MRVLSFSSKGGSLTSGEAVRVLANTTGTGLPPVAPQWFEGAGDGAEWQSTRVLPRTMELPLKIEGVNRQAVWDAYSTLAKIFAPSAGLVKFSANLDGSLWYCYVVRVGGGDFEWGPAGTDGSTILYTTLSVKAGNPYWIRDNQSQAEAKPGGLDAGILYGAGSWASMDLAPNNASGSVTLTNPGDAETYPEVTCLGPFTRVTFTSPTGQVYEWSGTVLEGESLIFDTELGTVKDNTGANRYSGIVGVAQFWPIESGTSTAQVIFEDPVNGSTKAIFRWRPKKWVMF